MDNAGLFHGDNHRSTDAVLHARRGIEIFQLGENGRLHPVLLRQFPQTDDRRVANRIDDAVEDPAATGTVHCTRSWRRIHYKLLCEQSLCI